MINDGRQGCWFVLILISGKARTPSAALSRRWHLCWENEWGRRELRLASINYNALVISLVPDRMFNYHTLDLEFPFYTF
jgi:hypothetical protein